MLHSLLEFSHTEQTQSFMLLQNITMTKLLTLQVYSFNFPLYCYLTPLQSTAAACIALTKHDTI